MYSLNADASSASIGWIGTGFFNGLSDCVCHASGRLDHLCILYWAGSMAGVLIDRALRRGTSNWNRRLTAFLDTSSKPGSY